MPKTKVLSDLRGSNIYKEFRFGRLSGKYEKGWKNGESGKAAK
jgi:hypothetical protein